MSEGGRREVGGDTERSRSGYLSDKQDGADLNLPDGGLGHGGVFEFPDVVALRTGATTQVVSIPTLADVAGAMDKEAVTIIY